MSKNVPEGFYKGPQAEEFAEVSEPFALFSEWFEDAKAHEPNDANAMSLATVDDDGLPNIRMVQCKDAGTEGFVFYTNLNSEKSKELQDFIDDAKAEISSVKDNMEKGLKEELQQESRLHRSDQMKRRMPK